MGIEQKRYWNLVAEKKEFTTPFHFEEFAKYVGKEDLILDVGCGYGRTLNQVVYTTMNGNKSNGYYFIGKSVK